MSRLQAESVINTIIGEIVKECAQRGQVVSETLGAFMVKAVLLDTRNGFDVNRSLTEQDVQNLQQLCVEKLTEKCSPALNTIQMQLYFDQNYTSRREFLKEIHQVLESRLSLVSREITDSRAKTMKDLDALYHQIVTYILLRSGLGSPTETKIVQEATADLQSIFLQKDLEAFLVLLKKDKEHMLKELTMLVTGIRLFNECGVELLKLRLPSSLKEALPVTGKCVIAELNGTQSLVWKYTAVLDKLTHPHIQSRQCDVPIVLLKQALYNIRQHEGFLKILQTDVCLCTKHVDILQMELFSQLKLLRETVQSKTAVPSASVFPLFRAISKLWSELQDEASLLNILSKITLSLKPFAISQTMFSEKYLDSLLEASEIKTDEQRMAESSDQQIDLIQLNTHEWLLPETISSFDELPLQYNGFCSYTFVTRDGLILPGNPCIGVLKHKEKLYAFSSKEAALKFASCPDKFVTEVVEKSKLFPELFQLLRLYQQLPCVSPDSKVSMLL
uniref:Cilia- and flagella-associated protein 206 n=1 Tax=Kryptolebias marmoratus TaxID=37003 RepID=A0A3Q3FNE2_KRYMA